MLMLLACSSTKETETKPLRSKVSMKALKTSAASQLKSKGRVVAIGDVHGDIEATRAALRLAGAIDDQARWIGGELVIVQTGDLLDRGDDEQAIIDLLLGLQTQARAAGGEIVLLNGNHEVMNVQGDLRYVTPGGFADFEDAPGVDEDDPRLGEIPAHARARASAFMPGGAYALRLADNKVIAIVDDTVFAHGGVLPTHVAAGIDALNRDTSAWMRGERDSAPSILIGESSPIWSRHFSKDPVSKANCAQLRETLRQLGATRMVVGHTVQPKGITSACNNTIWRIDTGMAAHYGGSPAVLEISSSGPRAITTLIPETERH